jgi:hypothetical protein
MLIPDKYNDSVTAEITTRDVVNLGYKLGLPVSSKEASSLLRDGALAHAMWKHMMEAGKQYIAESLEARHQDSWLEQAPGDPEDYLDDEGMDS